MAIVRLFRKRQRSASILVKQISNMFPSSGMSPGSVADAEAIADTDAE